MNKNLKFVIYIRCSLQTKDCDIWYVYTEEKTSDCYLNAVNEQSIFWQDYANGWCIYCTKEKLNELLPTLIKYYPINNVKDNTKWFNWEDRKAIINEINNIRNNYPEYYGDFLFNGGINKDKFRTN